MAITTEVFEGKFNISQEGVDQLTKLLVDLDQVAQRVSKSLGNIKLGKIDLSNAAQASQQAESIGQKINESLGKKTKAQIFEDAADQIRNLSESAKVSNESIVRGFEDVGQGIARATTSGNFRGMLDSLQQVKSGVDVISVSFQNVRDGIELATREGGNRFLGIRQAIFGVGAATNPVAKLLDTLGARTLRTSNATDQLAQSAQRISSELTRMNSALSLSTVSLKDAARAEGVNVQALSKLDLSVQKTGSSFQTINEQIRATGTASPRQLAKVGNQTDLLLTQVQNLLQSGIIPLGSKTAEQLRLMEKELLNNRSAVGVLTAQLQTVPKAASQTSKDTTFSFGKIRQAILGTRGASDEAARSIFRLQAPLEQVAKTADLAKAAFLGAFGAVFVDRLISSFGRLTAFVSAEFFQANDAVQNFRITIANMLKGTGAAVDEVQDGVEAFIRDVVAKTPFELTTAFASFQRLLTAGFDPKEWLTPVADAAAAVNKPMEQLIGALQRIQVGAKGIGIDMLRDFGIPVNQVGAFVDQTTGHILAQEEVLNDQRNLYDLNEQELTKLGISFNKLEFDKQGSLINDTNDALDILNGFLRQNATFAGAAESRSRSLTGVLSNLKDFISNLIIAAGQPIFDALTNGGTRLLQILDQLSPVLNSVAFFVGNNLATAIDFLTNTLFGLLNFLPSVNAAVGNLGIILGSAFGVVSNTVSQLMAQFPILGSFIQGVVNAISTLFSSDWANAWQVFLETVVNVVGRDVPETLNDFIVFAFDWGTQFIVEIAEGIFNAASSILVEAMNFVGSIVSSFLEPGSPPSKGPLSTIDDWGGELVGTFLSGFSEVSARDIDFVTRALEPIGEALKGTIGGRAAFQAIRGELFELTQDLKETGKINQDLLGNILGKVPDKIKPIVRSMADQLAIQEQINQAEKEGFVGADLKLRLKQQEDLTKSSQELGQQEDKFFGQRDPTGITGRISGLQQISDLEKNIGRTAASAAKKTGRAKLAASDAARKALGKEKESVEARYKRELELLEERRKLGLLSEEEYVKELLRIEQRFVEGSLEEGVVAGLEEHVSKINDLKDSLEGLKEASKGAGIDQEAFRIPPVGEILSGFAEQGAAPLTNQGQSLGSIFSMAFSAAATGAVTTAFDNVKASVSQSVQGTISSVGATLREFVTTTLPTVASTAFQNFWGWITEASARLVEIVQPLLTSFVNWANSPEAQTQIAEVGRVLGENFTSILITVFGDNEKIKAVYLAVGRALAGTITFILPAILKIGAQFIAGFIQGALQHITGNEVKVWTFSELENFLKFFFEIDWSVIGKNIIEIALSKMKETFEAQKKKVIKIGEDIIKGILEGLNKNVDKVRKFFDSLLSTDILGLIRSKLGIFSPSTVMAGVGSDIIDGLIEGLESGESSLKAITEKIVNESLFQPLEDLKRSIRTIASREGLGSIKSNMSRLIKDTSKAVLKNINDILPIISRLEKAGELTVERLANTIRDSIGVDQFGIAMDIAERHIEEFRDLIGSYDAAVDKANRAFRRAQLEVAGQLVEFGGSAGERLLEEQSSRIAAVRAAINEANGGLVEIDNQILNQAEAEGLLNTELEKQLSFQEKLAALEEKRQKLAFLQQQLDLINLLRENKVDVGDIFEGIKFGLDANLEDIINASDRAVQAIIESVSQGLEIGSPSQVMVEFGQQALQGLEDGLTQGNLVGSLVNIDGLIRALADSFDLVIARIDIMAGKLNQVNLGSFINTNTLGLAATPGLALPAGGSLPTGNQIINNFNVTISGPADERAFIRRVVDTIRREL